MAGFAASRVIYSGTAVAPNGSRYVAPAPVRTATWSTGGSTALRTVRAPVVTTRSITGVTMAKPLPPRGEFIPYYDPSRIITDIKLVQDIRQQGTERGETQTGDSGMLGPGGGVAPPRTGLPGEPGAPGAPGKNLIPIALAVAAFVLLGG